MTHERGEYLRRLGIEHFAPRRRLPGASEHALYRRAARGGVKSPLPKPALAVSEEPSTMSSAATSPQRMTSNESAMPPHSPRLSRFALLALRSNDLLLVDTLPAEATTAQGGLPRAAGRCAAGLRHRVRSGARSSPWQGTCDAALAAESGHSGSG